MQAIQKFSAGVLAEIIRRQPPSKAKTEFAWQLAVGPAVARATTVELQDGIVTVRAFDPRWTREIALARRVILARLQHLLGAELVTSIEIP